MDRFVNIPTVLFNNRWRETNRVLLLTFWLRVSLACCEQRRSAFENPTIDRRTTAWNLHHICTLSVFTCTVARPDLEHTHELRQHSNDLLPGQTRSHYSRRHWWHHLNHGGTSESLSSKKDLNRKGRTWWLLWLLVALTCSKRNAFWIVYWFSNERSSNPIVHSLAWEQRR